MVCEYIKGIVHVLYLWQNEIVEYADYHDRSNDFLNYIIHFTIHLGFEDVQFAESHIKE